MALYGGHYRWQSGIAIQHRFLSLGPILSFLHISLNVSNRSRVLNIPALLLHSDNLQKTKSGWARNRVIYLRIQNAAGRRWECHFTAWPASESPICRVLASRGNSIFMGWQDRLLWRIIGFYYRDMYCPLSSYNDLRIALFGIVSKSWSFCFS